MSKHTYTPGPWECKHHGEWITGRDSVRGEIVIAKTEGGDWAENARLIAAAPDMHALLTQAVARIDLEESPPILAAWAEDAKRLLDRLR